MWVIMNMIEEFESSYFILWLLKFCLNHRTAVYWREHWAKKDLQLTENGVTAQRGNSLKDYSDLLRYEAA